MKLNEYGRSMVEMLGVLSILFFLSVGGIWGYTKAMRQHRANEVINQATLVSANLRTVYVSQNSYKGLDNHVAYDLDVFPEDMTGNVTMHNDYSFDLSTLSNVYRGKVRVKESYGMERDGCIAIAMGDWGSENLSGLMGVHIMGAPQTEDSDDTVENIVEHSVSRVSTGDAVVIPGDSEIDFPLTVAQARIACSCVNFPTCAVSWKYF